MDIPISTEYPKLQAADPTRPSLADLPLEIQLIAIDILGLDNSDPAHCDTQAGLSRQAEFSHKTKIVLHAPPLNTTAIACRLFRFMYAKSRPTLWGAHLRRDHNNRAAAYHVDLTRDIFYVRIHRDVSQVQWNGANKPQLDPLAGALGGIQRMASSMNYVSMPDVFYLMHLNPQARELSILVPVPGLEGGNNYGTLPTGLRLAPVLTPLKADDVVTSRRGRLRTWWSMFKWIVGVWLRERGGLPFIPRSAEEREVLARTWQLCPAPEVMGYLVDERRLEDPNAWGPGDCPWW
ncbi:hypothetical protein C8A01DRAFT_42869 [Parachaetomium inaequale]|uniref:Uncharacterized protein n=1 Tax=Parachaetomium inaequale TaxID=2588326 RepID=A0AAN6PSF3_9PEZI|nr:hypothetical protein C8A01DRAFT_42869 [Parachaetomium inaequale]